MSPEGTINWMCFKNGIQEKLQLPKLSSLHLLDCVNFFCESPMSHKKHLGPPPAVHVAGISPAFLFMIDFGRLKFIPCFQK